MFLHLEWGGADPGGQRSGLGARRRRKGGVTEEHLHTADKTVQTQRKSYLRRRRKGGRAGWMRQDGNRGQDRKNKHPTKD